MCPAAAAQTTATHNSSTHAAVSRTDKMADAKSNRIAVNIAIVLALLPCVYSRKSGKWEQVMYFLYLDLLTIRGTVTQHYTFIFMQIQRSIVSVIPFVLAVRLVKLSGSHQLNTVA